MSSPPLKASPAIVLGHSSGRFLESAGSRWPQALIQNPQAAPREGLRLDDLVILSRPAAVRGE